MNPLLAAVHLASFRSIGWTVLGVLGVAIFLASASPVRSQEAATDGAAGSAGAAPGGAATGWPYVPLDPTGEGDLHKIVRGPGWYLSPFKIVACWVVFVIWVFTADRVSRDCLRTPLDYSVWNSVVVFVFLAVFFLVYYVGSFPVGFTLLILAYVVPLGAYVYVRNAAVEPHQRILTPDHLRHIFSSRGSRVGLHIDAEKKKTYEKGAQIELVPRGADSDQANQANLLAARNSEGFLLAKDLISDALGRRGDAVMLDYTREAVAVRYQIDGMWLEVEAQDRESGDAMLSTLKTLAALNPKERRQKQTGTLEARFEGRQYPCQLATQGTESGERVLLKIEGGTAGLNTLEDAGMRERMREKVSELIGADAGFLLVSALPGGGLSTTLHALLDETDRLMRSFVAIEDVANPEREVQNVDVTTFDAAAGETAATVLPKVIRSYPDVYVVSNLANAETISLLCGRATEEKLVIGGIRAKDAMEALLRVLMLKVPAQEFVPAITAVLNQRLIRKLCPECRVDYPPAPDVRKKLGLPPDRVKSLYRQPRGEEIDSVCGECNGVGYLGRTSIFELAVIDDTIRQVLTTQPKLELLRDASRKAGNRTLQEEGILLVAKGVTSLQELQRVLKQ